jgi:hypothetical protein
MHYFRAAILSGRAKPAHTPLAPKQRVRRAPRVEAEAEEPSLAPTIIARRQRPAAAVAGYLTRGPVIDPDSASAGAIVVPKSTQPRTADEEASLAGAMVSRRERRTADQRREQRHCVERPAMLSFRGKEYDIYIVNSSPRGLMVECGLPAHIAEEVTVRGEDGVATPYFVRWVRSGRLGLGLRDSDSAT